MASELRFAVMFYAMTVVWSLTTALRLLWEIIKHPIASLQKTKRTGKERVHMYTNLHRTCEVCKLKARNHVML